MLSITEVKLQNIEIENNKTRLNGGSVSLRRDVMPMHSPSEYYKEAKGIFNIKHTGKETLDKTIEDEMPTVLRAQKW